MIRCQMFLLLMVSSANMLCDSLLKVLSLFIKIVYFIEVNGIITLRTDEP